MKLKTQDEYNYFIQELYTIIKIINNIFRFDIVI